LTSGAPLRLTVSAQTAVAAPRSVRDGLFTDAQAARGQVAYQKACAECHMPDLGGKEYAGPLAGFGFQLKWQDASLGELFGRIRSMPLGRPGSLPTPEYVDILAYILQKNTYPAGANELTAALAAQRWPRIVIERVPEAKP
jgi:mono/diheme cytochrome c family protein